MKSKRVQYLSSLQVRDLRQAERHTLSLTRKLGDRVRKEAVKALFKDKPLREVIPPLYSKALTQGLVLGHLLGKKRAYLNAKIKPKIIALGIYDEAIKTYDRLDSKYLEFITLRYSTQAFKVLETASEAVEIILRSVLVQGLQKQLPINGLKQIMGQAFDRAGLTPTNGYQIENIVRTQTQLAFQAGKWRTENFDPDIADLLWGYEYATVGDDRVRPEHEPLDGTVLIKSSSFWRTFYPPNGWSCRCQAIPLYEEYPTKAPTGNAVIDPDFNFNAGEVFGGIINPETARTLSLSV